MQNIILFGAPGSGKGTQAIHLARDLSLLPISTGDLLRQEMKMESDIGQQISSLMNAGQFVSDEIVMALLRKAMRVALNPESGLGGVLFDGFPRTQAQVELLDGLLTELGSRVHHVLVLDVPHEEIVARLSGRFVCDGCGASYHDVNKPTRDAGVCDVCGSHKFVRRSDDQSDVIEKRLQTYEEQTKPLLSFYEKQGIVQVVPGVGDPLAIQSRLLQAVHARNA